jgi:hypothetical protein
MQSTKPNIYMYKPKTTASNSGTTAAADSFGGCNIAAPEPIELVVYMYWKEIAVELKQLSRVTVSTDASPSSANSMSTH